jgi:hypothetical protein
MGEAMNAEPLSTQHSEHPMFRLFVDTVLRTFAFLDEFSFTLDSCSDSKNECSVRFKNATTGVEIRYEMPNAPTVSVARLGRYGRFSRDHYGLKFIIAERCPERDVDHILTRSTPDTGFKELLESYAELLKEYATDILKGDFSVFPQLERHVRREMRILRDQTPGDMTPR